MAEQDLELDEKGEVVPPQDPPKDEDVDQEEGGEEAKGVDTDLEDHPEDTNESIDAEREAIRARRREERKHKKEVQRSREDTLKRELSSRDSVISDLTNRLSIIERKSSGMELSTIDSHLKQAEDAYNYFKNQIAVASAAGNHNAIADSTEKMIMARDRHTQLTNVRNQYQKQQRQPAPLDTRVMNHAQDWLNQNSWYDPEKRDEDSELASVIDARLAKEGWNPTTAEYWSELDSRLKKRLPHRYNSGYNKGSAESPRPRSPVASSGRESSGSSSGQTYKLSADRVSALKDLGIVQGTPEFIEHVKRYKEYDKQHAGQ